MSKHIRAESRHSLAILCTVAGCADRSQHGFLQVGVEICKGKGFYYQSQHASATRCAYLVPVADFISAVTAACPNTSVLNRTGLLHSTGRCGSTLLSRIMDAFSSSASLNEPDIYSNASIHYNMDSSPANQAVLGPLMRAATLMLATSTLAFYPSEKASEMSVWFKFRSVSVVAAGLMRKYMPETKSVYLYRNAVDYTDSACSGFMKMGFFPYFRMSGLDGFVAWKDSSHKYGDGLQSSLMDQHVQEAIQGNPEAFQRVFGIGFVGRMALMWQDNLLIAQHQQEQGVFDAVLRYEELVKYKEVIVRKMLEACGMSSKQEEDKRKARVEAAIADDVDRVFNSDAHEGSMLKSSRVDAKGNRIKEPVYIKTWEMKDMIETLALHPTVGNPNIILPGTLMA